MKKSIKTLLRKLEERHIARHVICPSVRALLNEMEFTIPNYIEMIDERSAGYVAIGMCAETEDPVVVWCADNDSYRNLTSALTEAYYRKLPILVVALEINSCINQAINPVDTIRYYVNNCIVGSSGTEIDIDRAIQYLFAEIQGPVYLSIGTYNEEQIRESVIGAECANLSDVLPIIEIIPKNACVHVGAISHRLPNSTKEIVFRDDHCTKDGNISMLIGASLIAREQLHVGIFTYDEIAYDLNMLGNRHIGNNVLLFCIKPKGLFSAIYDFAKRMLWDCRRIEYSNLTNIKDGLVICDKPQYIEVEVL